MLHRLVPVKLCRSHELLRTNWEKTRSSERSNESGPLRLLEWAFLQLDVCHSDATGSVMLCFLFFPWGWRKCVDEERCVYGLVVWLRFIVWWVPLSFLGKALFIWFCRRREASLTPKWSMISSFQSGSRGRRCLCIFDRGSLLWDNLWQRQETL